MKTFNEYALTESTYIVDLFERQTSGDGGELATSIETQFSKSGAKMGKHDSEADAVRGMYSIKSKRGVMKLKALYWYNKGKPTISAKIGGDIAQITTNGAAPKLDYSDTELAKAADAYKYLST